MNKEKITKAILAGTEYSDFLNCVENRKIVAFGATTIAEEVIKYIPKKVSYYIDNDSKKWNENLNGIPIYNPNRLLDEKEDVAIVVTNTYFSEISKQIEALGMKNFIILDGERIFSRLKALIKFEGYKASYEEFINRMPTIKEFNKNNIYRNKERKSDKKIIGVVVSSYIFVATPWYFMVMAGLLKYTGNDVVIILDDVNEFSDMLLDWEGASRYQDQYIENGIKLISEKLDIDVIKISELEERDLDEKDLTEIDKLAEINTIWKYRVSSIGSIPEINKDLLNYKEKYKTKLSYNLRKIKSILDALRFERIIVPTGIYDFMGLYNWLGKKEDIDVGSFDVAKNIGGFISTSEPCCQMIDIKKILEDNLLEDKTKKELSEIGKNKFQDNINISGMSINGVWQEVSYNEDNSEEKYDIIIPLNISWDSAALNKNRFFYNIEEWLVETIEYILNNTNFKVAVRQHPAEQTVLNLNHNFSKYNNFVKKYDSGQDLFIKLNNLFGKNERFRYIKCNEKINTYKLIKKARLVLPHTSTIGIESVILGKNVLIESDVYYGYITAVEKANSKEDYFNKIIELCIGENRVTSKEIEDALVVYMLLKFNYFKTEFLPETSEWLDGSVYDLLNENSVKCMLRTFGEGIPFAISKLADFKDNIRV